jgi:enoyl-CoA hydratase
MSTDLVGYSVSGNIAEVMLDRPPVNALSMDLIDALLAALAKARDDEAVRAVIIGSAHKVFCAGLDLDIVRGKPGIETKKFLERLYFALNDIQYRMGKPTIAAVDGAVRAGGMTIAISCNMIIASDACTFGYPEIDVGLIPAIHFVQLPRLVGKHQAFGPLFLGEPFDATTAFRMGLLSEVVTKGTALERARDRAQARWQIADRHEDRARCLHAGGRRRFPPLGRERGRELCACRNDGRLSGRFECVRRKADAELQGTLMAGLYFEEFEVGREFHHEFSRTVTEMDNTMFSLLTMNPQPLHIDAHFSENTEFGQRLFNSIYTLGIMIGMSVYDTTLGTTIGNLGMTDVKFPKPVFHGDTLKAHTKIMSKRESKSRPNQGIVEFEHTMTNQRGEVVASCRRTGLMHCKPKA